MGIATEMSYLNDYDEVKMRMGNDKEGQSGSKSDHNKNASEMAQDEALGKVVNDILSSGKLLSRKTLCMALLSKLDVSECETEKRIFSSLIRKLLHR